MTDVASRPNSTGNLTEHPVFLAWKLEPARAHAARHSQIVEYRNLDSRRSVIVKRITGSTSTEHASRVAEREYTALMQLRRSLGDELRNTIPEPLLWVPGTPTFAMSRLDGAPLGQLLKRQAAILTPWAWRSARRVACLVGQWLRRFHTATRQAPGEFVASAFLTHFQREVEKATRNGWPMNDARAVAGAVAAASRRAAGRAVPRAARQGDFSVQNILFDGDTVRVLDFENFSESDDVFEDVCALTSYLRLLPSSPLYAPHVLEAMRAGVVSAYGAEPDDPVFRLYELKLAIAVVAQFPSTGFGGQRRQRALHAQVATMALELERA